MVAVEELRSPQTGTDVDKKEYEEFFRAAYPLLARYAQRRFTPELAEELASTTLLTMWSKDLAAPEDDGQVRSLYAFAYRILDGHMKNKVRAEASRRKTIHRVIDQPVTPDVADEVLSTRWPEWVTPLPLTDLDLIELVVDGYKVAEIALILDCPPAAVSMRLQRAKKKARLLWQKEVDRGRQREAR
ncbi:sigma-70 family RNA polymerase sigma factor [Nocardioides alcanivorans]|uniref:sigma-70 family RNA polymerase sigma factor n=1 Tax=Nocardioides alcanivorans TaxID=2897352 RepID=UPI001F320BEC|nr:sigma-70 family RNA polymerase sigma factor [Nocardioides alcanivorans]